MIERVVLTVALKVTDNETLSALEALRTKMGMADSIVGLAREVQWELDVEADSPESARCVIAEIVERTNVFLNPNKHRSTLASTAHGYDGLDDDEVAILVTDRDGAESAAAVAAASRIGVMGLRKASRRIRWRVRLAEAPSPGDPGLLPLLRRIGVSSDRGTGLFSNPHSQTALVAFPWGDEKPLDA